MKNSEKTKISFNNFNINVNNNDINSKSKSEGLIQDSKSISEFSMPKSENNVKKELKGKIQFKNVYFSYPERAEEILFKGVNFTIEPGQRVAIVCSLDSGKNIIFDLMERFYDVSHGEILIDDINIKNYDLISLRKQIAIVMDIPYFINSQSIKDNLKNGNPQASEAEVNLCIEMFDLLKLIELEKELIISDNRENNNNENEKNKKEKNTKEEKSKNSLAELSELDLIKISIGRAKLINPKIIIIENSLAYFNYKFEKEIDNLINKASQNTTAINIIDKPFCMKKYDLILFFEEGIIIEQGRHKNLMKRKGFYYRFYIENK